MICIVIWLKLVGAVVGAAIWTMLLFLGRFLEYIAGLAGLAAHLMTTLAAYNHSGAPAAILTFCIPILSEIYWIFQLDPRSSSLFLPIAVCSAIWAIVKIGHTFLVFVTTVVETSRRLMGKQN